MSDCNLEFHFETDPAPLITGNMSAVCGWIKFGVIILHEHDAAKSFPSQSTLSIQPAKPNGKTGIKANLSDTNVQIRTRASQIQFDILWSNEASYSVISLSHAALQACPQLPDCCSALGGSDSALLTSAAARQMSFNPCEPVVRHNDVETKFTLLFLGVSHCVGKREIGVCLPRTHAGRWKGVMWASELISLCLNNVAEARSAQRSSLWSDGHEVLGQI